MSNSTTTQYHLGQGGDLVPYQWLPDLFPHLKGAAWRKAMAAHRAQLRQERS